MNNVRQLSQIDKPSLWLKGLAKIGIVKFVTFQKRKKVLRDGNSASLYEFLEILFLDPSARQLCLKGHPPSQCSLHISFKGFYREIVDTEHSRHCHFKSFVPSSQICLFQWFYRAFLLPCSLHIFILNAVKYYQQKWD